jgi:hypothetical protein
MRCESKKDCSRWVCQSEFGLGLDFHLCSEYLFRIVLSFFVAVHQLFLNLDVKVRSGQLADDLSSIVNDRSAKNPKFP